MKRTLRFGAGLALLLAAVSARAGLFGRGKLESRWAAKPLPVNADDSDWNDSAALEEDGWSWLAMNDGANLYLLVTAHTRDGREQLTGEARQDVGLWFLGADGKSRDWGAKLPYTRRSPLSDALRDPAGVDPEPEFASYQGPAVSTSPWPSDLEDRLSSTGRRPVWEIKIPLKRLAVGPEGAVLVDFTLSDPKGGVRRRPAEIAPEKTSSPEGGGGDGGGRRGKGKGNHSPDSGSTEPLQAATYGLTLRLAPAPGAK